MLEALVPAQAAPGPHSAVQSEAPSSDFMSATYGGTPSSEASKRSELAPTVSSSALLQSTPQKIPMNAGWKKGVMDRNNTLPTSLTAASSASSSPASTLRNRLDPDSLEDDAMMATLMPGSSTSTSESPARPSFSASSHRTLRPSQAQQMEEDSEEDEYDEDDMDMDMDDTEELDGLFPSSNRLMLSDSSASTSSNTTDILSPKPSTASAHSSKSLLGPPPTTAARTPPTTSPPSSLVLPTTSTSPSPPLASPAKPGVPMPPPAPTWFEDAPVSPRSEAVAAAAASSPPNSPSQSSAAVPPTTPPQSRFLRSGPGRPQIRGAAARITLAGTDEDMGMVRRADLARLPMPRFRKDYHVSILIQYSDNSKDVLEYKNRVHPDCTGADIIQECVNKTRKKVPNWSPPADKFQAFELIIPAKNDEDEDIIMDLETPVWKYCFIPGEVTRLVLRLKMRFDSTRLALKIRTDRGPLRTMMFYSITPISMVIEKIQHKIKSAEKRGPPFTGLFVFDNKRGRFLENLGKTLGDYRVKHMDIIQVKRRRLMELCLRDQPKRNLMIPLDLTASLLAEQLHDWLRLDPVDPSLLSLVKVVPKRGNVTEMQLVLNANTEVRSFNLFKDDVIQLRRKNVGKDGNTISSATAPVEEVDPTGPPRAALPLNLMASLDSRHVKSGSQQVSKSSSENMGSSPRANAVHASIKLAPSPSGPSSSTAPQQNTFLGGARSHVADSMGTIVATFQVAFAGNAHDSQTFSQSSFMAGSTRRFPPPKLMMGEVGLFQTIYGIYLWDSATRISMLGDVHITNYRLVFSSFSDDTLSDYFIDVPLTTIARVEKTGDKSKPGLKIDCKDFRTLRFHFERAGKENRRQMRRLLEECLYPNFKQLFSLAFKSSKPQPTLGNVAPSLSLSSPRRAPQLASGQAKVDGWSILDLRAEFQRLGVGTGDKGSKWRISTLNDTYAFSKTYPSMIVVPSSISDEELVPVFKYRSKGRLPALSWLNSRTGASITRCSQPLSGMTKKTSPDDANLISAIKEAQGSADAKLHLLDARPRANAIANMAMGGGFEVMGGSAYNGCDLEFLNIGNIHVMRNSLSDLKSLIESQPYDNSFLSRIEASGWLFHISLILQGAVKIVEHMQQRHSCVLHCSDGWDRTSQLSSVAMLLLDPYYRTIKGFCILIEKEWCSFGHKFASRNGHIAIDHVDKNYAHGERAPIFLQFIDCVFQIIRQFPLAFEFTENVLLCVLEHLYSCHYGTFLFDCERERREADLVNKTESLWTFILDPENDDKFKNIFYEPFDSILPLAPTLADVVLWRAYYRRWYAPPDEDKATVEEKIRTLVHTNERQAERIAQLELRLAALERK